MIEFKRLNGETTYIKEKYIISISDFTPHEREKFLKDAKSILIVAYESTTRDHVTQNITKLNTSILYSVSWYK